MRLDEALAGAAVDPADLAGLVLRHGDFDVADPVAAMSSGAEPPPVRLVRAWAVGLGGSQLDAVVASVREDLSRLPGAAERALLEALILRDRVESRVRVLALPRRADEVRGAVAEIDAWARETGLDRAPSPSAPRLRAAWLEPGARWWARA